MDTGLRQIRRKMLKTVPGGTGLYQPSCCRTRRRSASSSWTEIRSARSGWMWCSRSFTGCTGRTVPSRGFWNWLRYLMWAAGSFPPRCLWINCTPRLSWRTWECARQHTRQCTGNSLCIWNRWWNGWRSIFPIPYLLNRPMQAPPGA